MKLLLSFLFVAVLLNAEDPSMVKNDARDSARIMKLLSHQQVDAAEIGLILSRYAQTHNCPTGKAGLGNWQIQCEAVPMKPIPVPPPGTAN